MAKTTADPLAALDATARELHAAWTTDKDRLAAHRADTVRDGERLTTVRAAYIEAQVAGDAARVTTLRSERVELEERLSTAAAVEAGLVERAKASGLVWSAAWTDWRNALERELLGSFAARRARVEEDEAAAREAFERAVGEMPA